MIKNGDFDAIIIVTGSRWDQDYSSASISLARELSKGNKVFFIDNPFTLKDIFIGWRSQKIRRRLRSLFFASDIYTLIEKRNKNWVAVTPMAVLPINWLPKGFLYKFFSDINNRIFIRAISKVIKDHSLSNYIYFNSYNPFYGYVLSSALKPAIKIYQSRDNIRESEYVSKHGPALESIAAQSSDIRLATSTDLVNQLSSSEYPFIFFPNAADFELFNTPTSYIPVELSNIKKPVIGYMGNICLRIDYDLLFKIASQFKDCTLLMVGPRNDANYNKYNFDELKNVVFVGTKKISELPNYLAVMDCAILPFKKNALTKSIYPLKINEYLAGGKPVVTTSFSPDIETFRNVIYLSGDHESFAQNIQAALSEKDPQLRVKRVSMARENSWAERVKQFWRLVRDYQST